MRSRLAIGLAALTLMSGPALAQSDGWKALTPPADNGAEIDFNPLQGYYSWIGSGIVPTPKPSGDFYVRVTWRELEPAPGVYDFSPLEKALASLGPDDRIAFGVMPMDTCCSRSGVDVPDYLKDKLAKGWWIKADPGNWAHLGRTYVPDWNDPYYLERWRLLWGAIGDHFNNDPRLAWIDLRGYGNWGEGHLAGANAYADTQMPYGDASANPSGAEPGTLATKLAIVDAIADALPDTQLLAMTDDKDVLIHALKRDQRVPIGMRRDSWGSQWFESVVTDSMKAEDKALIRDRWKTAPFIVESYGWEKVFEVGYDGIVLQIAHNHVSAIGNGNFNVKTWGDLNKDQQTALIRSGAVAGYRYLPTGIRYRSSADCPLEVETDWQNHGVAPAYEPWQLRYWLRAGGDMVALLPVSVETMPRLLPGNAVQQTTCLSAPQGTSGGELYVQIADPRSGRTMTLPLDGGDKKNRYALGVVGLN